MIDIHNTERIAPTKALIYCRTATESQMAQGCDADYQEALCRACADGQGKTVEGVFRDTGVSRPTKERPSLQELLDHIAAHPDETFVVFTSGIERTVQDQTALIELWSALARHGAVLEIIGQNHTPSPEDRFYAAIVMALGECDTTRETETEGA